MYQLWAYISVFLLAVLVPFQIPINRLKTLRYRKIRVILGICLLVSVLISVTPEKAVNGAPVHTFGEHEIAFLGCSFQISKTAIFCDPDLDINDRECFCKNPNAMATIAYCYKTAHETEIESFMKMCSKDYNVTITNERFDEAFLNYTKYAKSIDEIDDYDKSKVVYVPIRLNDSIIQVYRGAYDQFLGNYDRSVYYGGILIGYWVLVLFLAAVGNWSKILFPKVTKKMTGKISNKFRKTISLPATGGRRKTTEKSCFRFLNMLVPTRAETLILVGFVVLTIELTRYKIQYFEGDPVFSSKRMALLRYIAVRTSILSSELMPLLILFSSRNNFLQWLTRWDYATFITFHRWLSRIIFLLVVIHSVCYSFYLSPYIEKMSQIYVLAGVGATFAGGFIMVQGLLVLRRKWYEMFLFIHIILAVMFIGGAYAHVNDLYCLWFYYYSAAIWFFDRAIRVGRLISFGFPDAKVILLADETLKIIVPTPQNWESIPGGHAFIHFLKPSCFWQSHPFTYTTSEHEKGNIILYIKVKEGVTQQLYKYLLNHPGKSTHIRVAIEGPYGEMTPASRYDTAVFVAGGNGIPGIYAEAYDLAVNSNDSKQSLKLIWIVREYKSLLWFYDELVSLRGTNIQTTIYVTKPDSSSELEDFERGIPYAVNTYDAFDDKNNITARYLMDSEPPYGNGITVNDTINKFKAKLHHIEFKEGRPLLGLLVSQNVYESRGSTSFITCGHPIMVDDLRASVVKNIDNKEGKRVDYFEQLQVWA